MQQHQSLGKKPPFLAAQRTGAPLSGEVRLCLQTLVVDGGGVGAMVLTH